MRELGLEYVLFQTTAKKVANVRVQGASIVKTANQRPKLVGHFIEANHDFMRALVHLFAKSDGNFANLYEKAASAEPS